MILVIPFACEPGDARLARVFARQVQRRLARGGGAARFMPLAAEREGEIHFLNRRDPFDPAEAARLGREQGAAAVLDGRLDAGSGGGGGARDVEVSVQLVDVAEAWIALEARIAFPPADFFDGAAGVVDRLLEREAAGRGPPIVDLEAFAMFLEAEEMAMRPYASAAEAGAARERRAALLAEAARRDGRIRGEVAGF